MKFDKKYTGKWVAIKNDKVVADDASLKKLTKKIDSRSDKNNLRFTLIPDGFIAGRI